MLSKILIPLFTMTSIAFMTMLGCRQPLIDESWTPVYGDDHSTFDASAGDDAGVGEYCPSGSPNLLNNKFSPYLGGEETIDLAVVSVSYFRCPHCAHFAELFQEIWANNPEFQKRVRIYYHHYPFSNDTAWKLHAAAVAAGNQGMKYFWAMHDYIYDGMNAEDPKYYSVEDLEILAENTLLLDMYQWNYDRDPESNPDTYAFLKWDKAQAEAIGVTGTPSVFVCGEKISWGSLEDIVKSYLNID